MAQNQSLRIDVVSDVVCPWCYVGQKRLDSAIAATSGVDVVVNWRPFQLDPTIPAGGMDRKAYMMGKFGSEERLREIHARLESLGAAEGISFDFGAIRVSPNTLDAHRLIRWTGTNGPAIQNAVVRKLFSLYFEQGRNIGDHEILADAATDTGMERAVVASLLAGNADNDAVAEEVATASRMGITGVPCFLLEGKYALMGAQDASVLADAIRQVADAKSRGELDQ